MTNPVEPATRTLASRYRLREVVGRGGMGAVWRAVDELLDREVAVKELTGPAMGGDAARRAVREARSLARVRHPSVVTVFDVVEEDGRPWVVMELLDARSLQDVVADEGPLPPDRAARVGRHVLAALAAAHAVGVVHRDVKPGNVLLTRDGRVLLTDFGIAVAEGDPALTMAGQIVGSPGYIPPERLCGQRHTPASDLWALGATLYAAATGAAPFRRAEPAAAFVATLTEEPVVPPHAQALRPVLEGLLRKDPLQRMTPDEAEAALAAFDEEPPPSSGPPADPGTAWRLGGLLTLAGTVILLISAIVVLLR